MDKERELPEPEVFLLEAGLYERFTADPQRIRAIERFTGTLDFYCAECGRSSVFKSKVRPLAPDTHASPGLGATPGRAVAFVPPPIAEMIEKEEALKPRVFAVDFECSRDASHLAVFVVRVAEGTVCKIGQFPSRSDLHYPELKRYRKILGEQYLEFSRAVGLAAHGIGIGSFVYLRRIFERLVGEASEQRAQQEPGWDIEEWHRKRMKEKIESLADYLPEFLVQNSGLYEILSVGVHAWDEQECLQHFDVVRLGIEAIMDDRLADVERRKKQTLVKKSIAKVKTALGVARGEGNG